MCVYIYIYIYTFPLLYRAQGGAMPCMSSTGHISSNINNDNNNNNSNNTDTNNNDNNNHDSRNHNSQKFDLRVSNLRTTAYFHFKAPLWIQISQGLEPCFSRLNFGKLAVPGNARFRGLGKGRPQSGASGTAMQTGGLRMHTFMCSYCYYVIVYYSMLNLHPGSHWGQVCGLPRHADSPADLVLWRLEGTKGVPRNGGS